MKGNKQVVLDWSRLLGFDQIARNSKARGEAGAAARLQDPRVAKLGARIGAKPGFKT